VGLYLPLALPDWHGYYLCVVPLSFTIVPDASLLEKQPESFARAAVIAADQFLRVAKDEK
jgi:hypothetical protein